MNKQLFYFSFSTGRTFYAWYKRWRDYRDGDYRCKITLVSQDNSLGITVVIDMLKVAQ